MRWIGLGNFQTMAGDEYLRLGLGNLALLLIACIVKTLTLPLLVAELIVSLRSTRLQQWLRTLFTLPMVADGARR